MSGQPDSNTPRRPQDAPIIDVPYAADAPAPTLYDDAPALAPYNASSHVIEPDDFDHFWQETLVQARTTPADLRCETVRTHLRTVTVEDVTFPGWAGQPIRGWLITPAEQTAPLPLVVQYCGYGGGRGLPHEHLGWASAGFAHFVMDSRGQGMDTPDAHPTREGPDGSYVLRGIADPRDYYYRRLIVDAVRAVDCLTLDPRLDPQRVVVTGASQGGGLALAVAALHTEIALLLCDIPFLCHWDRATQIADRGPYSEVNRYCATYPGRANAASRTLRYFDGAFFATRATAPALFSVGLRDRVCPPSTVQLAYQRYAGPKELVVHEHNDHEGGGAHQHQSNVARAAPLLRAPCSRAEAILNG
jgi:cephalosporin-C deacetylase